MRVHGATVEQVTDAEIGNGYRAICLVTGPGRRAYGWETHDAHYLSIDCGSAPERAVGYLDDECDAEHVMEHDRQPPRRRP